MSGESIGNAKKRKRWGESETRQDALEDVALEATKLYGSCHARTGWYIQMKTPEIERLIEMGNVLHKLCDIVSDN